MRHGGANSVCTRPWLIVPVIKWARPQTPTFIIPPSCTTPHAHAHLAPSHLITRTLTTGQLVVSVFIAGQLMPALLPHLYERLYHPRDLVGVLAISSSADTETAVPYGRAAVGESDQLWAQRCDDVIPSPPGFPPLSNQTIRWLHIPKVVSAALSADHPYPHLYRHLSHHSPFTIHQCGSSLAVTVLRYGCRVPSVQSVLAFLPFSLLKELNVSSCIPARHDRAPHDHSLVYTHAYMCRSPTHTSVSQDAQYVRLLRAAGPAD
jgi:hypothetical protein